MDDDSVIGGLGAALSALAVWAWKHTHDRIDGKADKAVITDIAKIEKEVVAESFDRLENIIDVEAFVLEIKKGEQNALTQ